MKDNYPLLRSSPLFAGINSDDFDTMLDCLGASLITYDKDEVVYYEGDTITQIGLAVSGRLHLLKGDVWGNTSIVEEIIPPQMFAEAAVCGGEGRIPVSVVSKERCGILFIDYGRIISVCSSSCAFHGKLIRNMIGVLARKNMVMASKMEHITKRTIKEKLLSYLGDVARQKNSRSFDISFNRQELADYLFVERSALSAQMSKLKAEGIINYRKNHFELLRHVSEG